ncbi:flavin reductase family protein [Uliginosibacterium sp. H3]|uniref:Flavin reductase family protein n=1 Tax=Uliginosibacterium silvisoli TaxID=3114758 RepID=A0ABU6JYI7_9RHOO|nr:flavin reductase family protein [Uliginosibacterium sp. H3]
MQQVLPEQQSFDTKAFRRALGMFATGITVMTTRAADGSPVGLTVNSFNAVSLTPPMIVWSLSRHLSQRDAFEPCRHYAVNVLSADQVELSRLFAGKATDKFSTLEWDEGIDGVPLLRGCCAHFEVRNEIRHDGGDHLVFLSEVLRFERFERDPLLYFSGHYRHMAPLP